MGPFLILVEFTYNVSKYKIMPISSFEVVINYIPRLLLEIIVIAILQMMPLSK
jgi:hypothetical protein